jgi:RsiW-degrading membrane proteinase PrsW (M82 family)
MIQSTAWVIPMVQSVHILCIAIVFASMAMLDLRLIGISGRSETVSVMMERFYPWFLGCLALMALTGTVLVIAEPQRELMNDMFRLKMILVLAAAVLTVFVRSDMRHRRSRWEVAGALPRLAGGVSLLIWVCIVICGRWIAYTQ